MTEFPPISIIGPGKVGAAIGALAMRAGWPIAAVGGRRIEAAQAAARFIEEFARQAPAIADSGSRIADSSLRIADSEGRSLKSKHGIPALSPVEAARLGRLILLTVSDDAIEGVCAELVQAGAIPQGAIVAHCSGALGSDIFASAREAGGVRLEASGRRRETESQNPEPRVPNPDPQFPIRDPRSTIHDPRPPSPEPRLPTPAPRPLTPEPRPLLFHVASFHPLQTFPTVEAAVARLPGAWCFCEGDEPAVRICEQLAGALGCRFARIALEGKTYYHLAAVMACNYLAALTDAALELAECAAIPRETAMQALHPIMSATLDNVAALGPTAALTGPIARGDVETVRRHLKALASRHPDLLPLYRAAGLRAAQMAKAGGALPPAAAQQIRHALEISIDLGP